MAMAKYGGTARVGATAVVLGLSLAGPGVGVAAADGSEPAPAASDTVSNNVSDTASHSVSAAPAKAGATRAADRAHRPDAAPGEATSADRPVSTGRVPNRERVSQRPGADSAPPRSDLAAEPTTPTKPTKPAPQNRIRRPSAAVAPVIAPEPTRDSAGAAPAAEDTAPTLPLPDAAPAAQIAPVARQAAQAATDWVTELLSPIQAFVEGIALLVRRTLFNEAPTVNPQQSTGQVDGPITGSVGAIDPEGDPITYSVSQQPLYGTVAVETDGTYTYTPASDFEGVDTFVVTATDTGFHINLLDIFRPAGTDANLVVRQGVSAPPIQFTFIYRRGAQFWSPAARSALESVATMLASRIVASTPVNLTFDVTGEFSILPSSLASAGSDLISSDPGFHPTVVQHKILTGEDSNGSAPDGEINWNFGYAWAFSGPVLSSQYDFRSTAMHELLHTLGFLSNVDAPGNNTYQDWTSFDAYVVTEDGVSPIDADYSWISAYNPNLTSGNGGFYFSGPNAVAAYGRLVPLYTPSIWESGSSMSHLDDRTFVGANEQLMNAQAGMGTGVRELSAVELGVLKDLGYTLVGDPSMLAFIFVGFAIRRRPPRLRRAPA